MSNPLLYSSRYRGTKKAGVKPHSEVFDCLVLHRTLGAHRVHPLARVEATCRPGLSHRCRIVRSTGAWYRVEQDRLVVRDSLQHESVPVGIEDHAVEVRLSGVDGAGQRCARSLRMIIGAAASRVCAMKRLRGESTLSSSKRQAIRHVHR